MKNKESLFTNFVQQHKSTIYTVCYMFSNDEDEVKDLFQDTLLNLWKGFDTFRGDSKASTWVYRITMNTCISADRRRRHRKDTTPLSMDVNLYEDNDSDTLQVKMLHNRINKLGLVDRAIVLMWLENMTYEEIASVVGISAQNVGVKLYRIKEQLKRG